MFSDEREVEDKYESSETNAFETSKSMTHGWDIRIKYENDIYPVKGEVGASGSYTSSSSKSQSSIRMSGKSTKTKKIVSSEVACKAQPWETKTCYIQRRFRTVKVPWTATEKKVDADGRTTSVKINGWKTTLGAFASRVWSTSVPTPRP